MSSKGEQHRDRLPGWLCADDFSTRVRSASAPTRVVVIAVGTESQGFLTGRTSVATAEALGEEATEFPSNHGGFFGGEFGHSGQPEAFAARLREVLEDR
ncbi:MAG: putative hydrolase [Nocardioides sp.]|nr:putative hydrolase [Nocardioides sp.]